MIQRATPLRRQRSLLQDKSRLRMLLPLPLLLLLLLLLQAPASTAAEPIAELAAGEGRHAVSLPPPFIEIDSHDDAAGTTAVLGSTRRLTCYSTVTDSGVRLVWYRNGVKMDGSFGAGTLPNGLVPATVNEMQFRVVTSDIGATYECRVQIAGQAQTRSATVQLDIVGPPLVDGYQAGHMVKLGDAIELTCTSIGGSPTGSNSPVTVTWHREGKELASSTHHTAPGARPPSVYAVLSTRVDVDSARLPYTCRVTHPRLGHNLEADVNVNVDLPFSVTPVVYTRTAVVTEPPCKVSPLIDFVFVLDSSSSIKPQDFRRQKQFVKDFVGSFDVDPDNGTRFGAVQFGTKETLEFQLGTYRTRADVQAAIERIRQTGVETYLDRGLRFYREQMRRASNGARAHARAVAIIITDGDATDKDAAHTEARLVRGLPTELWAIGVGEVKRNELLAVTDDPERTFFATDYDALRGINHQFVEAAKYACEKNKTITTTPRTVRPPEPPVLLLYKVGDPVVMGEDYEIECMSANGDESTEMIWYKDDVPVDRTYRHEVDAAYNHHRLRIDPSDADAVYSCRVTHPLLPHQLNLSFTFPIIGKPKIVGYDRGRELPIGGLINFVCFSVSSAADVVMTWHKNGQLIESAEPADKLQQSLVGQLDVTVTADDDMNEYSCQVSHPSLRQPLSDSVHLTVVAPPGPPEVRATPPNGAFVGETVNMTCTSEGTDLGTSVYWLRNGVKVDETFEIVDERIVNTYSFVARSEDIEAHYECLVENERAKSRQRVPLPYVIWPLPGHPRVRVTPPEGAFVGETVNMTCTSEGADPGTSLAWFRNGIKVDESFHVAGDGVVNTYTFVARHEDIGARYECLVENERAKTTERVHLPYTIWPLPGNPQVTATPPGGAFVGDTVNMTCTSDSAGPGTTLSWLRNGLVVDDTFEKVGSRVVNTYTFVAHRDDLGARYECLVQNNRSKTRQQVHLPYIIKPRPGAPQVNATPPDRAFVGDTVSMRCTSEGTDPGTLLTWLRNGERVSENFKVGSGQLVNTYSFTAQPEDIGAQYECLVENTGAKTQERVPLPYVITYPPAEPPVITGYNGAPLEPDATVTLVCRSRPARPDSRLLWSHLGVPVKGAEPTRVDKAGDFVESALRLTGAEYVSHGSQYICQLLSDSQEELEATPPATVTLVVMLHGGWSDWSQSSPCSVTCGSGGTAAYQRRCDNPAPEHGGRNCTGPATELRPCSAPACPTVPTTTTPPPTTAPPARCDLLSGPLDVAFVVDSSDSIYERDFAHVVRFVGQAAALFNVTGGYHRIGAVLFGRSPLVAFPLGQHRTQAALQGALKTTIRQRAVRGDATNTAAALRYTRHVLFGGAVSRENVPKVAIIVTDGHSQDPQATAFEARRMRSAGILTVAVGVAVRSDDQQELHTVAGNAARVVQVSDYSSLAQLAAKDLPGALRSCKIPADPCASSGDSGDDDLYPSYPHGGNYWSPSSHGCPASCRDSCGWRRGDGDRRHASCGAAARGGYCRQMCAATNNDHYDDYHHRGRHPSGGGCGDRRGSASYDDYARNRDRADDRNDDGAAASAPRRHLCRSSCYEVDTMLAYNGAVLPRHVAHLMKAVVRSVSHCTSTSGASVSSRTSLTLAASNEAEQGCNGAACKSLDLGVKRGGSGAPTSHDAGRVLRRLSDENELMPTAVSGDSSGGACCRRSVALLFLSDATSVDDLGHSAATAADALRFAGVDVLAVVPRRFNAEALAASRRLVSLPSSDAYWHYPDASDTADASSLIDAISNKICRETDFRRYY